MNADLRRLADDILALALATPGVAAVHPRPGMGQLTRIVREGLSVVSAWRASTPVSDGSVSPIDVVVAEGETRIEFDVAVVPGRVGPVVARAVAAAARSVVGQTGLPPAVVDVRVVSLG